MKTLSLDQTGVEEPEFKVANFDVPQDQEENMGNDDEEPKRKYPNGVHATEKMEFIRKKRAHIMIKAIDKQLKERRMMKSFEKFAGGRHYGTNLRLLQRTI
ncbi:hypothetical protein Tco_0216075 [Tanacetum coccineum]